MPLILLALDFIKKYWVYFAIGFAVLLATAYAGHIYHEAHMYKQEKVVVAKQQKTITDYGVVLQKQKNYSVDMQTYENDLVTQTLSEQSKSVIQKENFQKVLGDATKKTPNVISTDVTNSFNSLFDGFNNEK